MNEKYQQALDNVKELFENIHEASIEDIRRVSDDYKTLQELVDMMKPLEIVEGDLWIAKKSTWCNCEFFDKGVIVKMHKLPREGCTDRSIELVRVIDGDVTEWLYECNIHQFPHDFEKLKKEQDNAK